MDRSEYSGDLGTCPCGSGESFAACCGPFLDAGQVPATAEQLMRSRFSAYCRGRVDYLVDTTHPEARTRNLRQEIAETARRIRWTSLKILSTRSGGAADKVGKVEFEAGYVMDGVAATHHERSRFRRFQGRWHYLDDQG